MFAAKASFSMGYSIMEGGDFSIDINQYLFFMQKIALKYKECCIILEIYIVGG